MSSPSSSGNPNEDNSPLDAAMKAVSNMSNMLIAHKIATDKDFKLEPGMDMTGPLMSLSPIIGSSPPTAEQGASEPNLHHQVKDIIHEAYWDLFRNELKDETPATYKLVKQLLADIKQHILDLLLAQHTRLKQEICDRLDPVVIEQQCRNDAFDLKDYAAYILKTMSMLCAPVRDIRLRELSECTDLVEVFRGIMEVLELMRLDLANFTLNKFRPHIKAHSQSYEREKFNEILEQQKSLGLDGLEFTKIWLKRAVKNVEDTHGLLDYSQNKNADTLDDLDLENTVDEAKSSETVNQELIDKILNTAYCELLEWNSKKQELFPETLLFDEATYRNLSIQYQIFIMTSSILITTFAFISQFKLNENDDFKMTLKSHIITLLTASSERPHQTSGPSSPKPRSRSPSRNRNDKFKSDCDETEKLELVTVKLIDDIKTKLDESKIPTPSRDQQEMFRKQILDLQSENNRVRNLVQRRINEFVETLLKIDVKHQQKKGSAPPVNIPLGLSCLANEITMTLAQFVKLVRYNRVVFFEHYLKIIKESVKEIISAS